MRQEGLDLSTLHELPHSFNPRDLIEGRVDAMSAYVTNELFELDKAGLAGSVALANDPKVVCYPAVN